MRVSPVTSLGRANVRRKRPSVGETETERRTSFAASLPAAENRVLERDQRAFTNRYRPNSVFLAHLIATRDYDIQSGASLLSETLNGVNSYRSVASSPRQRAVGYVLKTER